MDRPKDSSPTSDPARNRLLANLGRDHFLHGRSKVRIAEAYGLSRFQVANLLQEALERGIVRISIHLPDDEADATLAAALGIDQVVTVGTGSATVSRDELARAVADALTRTTAPGDTIGMAWSRTLQVAVRHLPAMPTCTFVQLSGAIAADWDVQGPRLLAGLEARAVWPLWAPLVVHDAVALRTSHEVQVALDHADNLDVAVFAIGLWKEGLSTVWDRMPVDARRAGLESGAVAEISGRLLDARGRAVTSPVDDMVVSATLEQIARAGRKIAVAYGTERAPAVLAAVRGGLVDMLVGDVHLHEALTALLGKEAPVSTEHSGRTGAS